MDWKTLFLSPEGRIGRRDFWIGFVVIMVASIVLNLIPIIGQLIGLLLIWPNICITAKRLHDMGKTGWLMLIPAGVSVVCGVVALVAGGMAMIGANALGGASTDSAAAASAMAGFGMVMAIMGIAVLVGFAFLLWIGLSNGEPGPNRFGPPPKSLADSATPPATTAA
jgi:uncharacterized membrane protein YhaH (DUF805 family)